MDGLIRALEKRFRMYEELGAKAFAQVPEAGLAVPGPGGGNSLAVLCWHVSGNLKSRFTDFLTTDGEKPWRDREEEFAKRRVTRAELDAKWKEGWEVLFATLATLTDAELGRSVTIRGESMAVHDALFRALGHLSYHVGQIVYVAHSIVGNDWKYLSIPPGGSTAFNAAMASKPAATAR